jgi:hypothetical protein
VSPIIDIQRRMVEVGRLRMGNQVPYTKRDGTTAYRAAKLEHWRLTSRDRARLDAAAALYGGEVRPWAERDGEFELFTSTAELPILILPGQTLSQWYETWSAGGCQRRCDGAREVLTDQPCICDTEKGDRACKPTTRLSVMLPDVPGLGCWRLESHGYYAAVELSGTATMLENATARGQLLPARLRIDQRTKVEGGKTTRYAVPVIDIDITVRQALPGLNGGESAPAVGYTPVPQFGGVTIEDGLDAVGREAAPRASGRQAAAIGPAPTDHAFESAPIPVDVEPPLESGGVVINEKQRALLWATCGDRGIPEVELRRIVGEVTGQESTKLIPRDRFDQVLKKVEALSAVLPAELETERKGLVDLLLAHGKERGLENEFRSAIADNIAGHALDPENHVQWLRGQVARFRPAEGAAA